MISGSGLSRSGRLLVKFSEITSRTSDLSDLLSWFFGFLLFLPFRSSDNTEVDFRLCYRFVAFDF